MNFDVTDAEWLGRGWLLLLAFTATMTLLLLLRWQFRHFFGPESAFQLWALPLLAILASQLPHSAAAEPSHLPTVVFVITSATHALPSAVENSASLDWRLVGTALWLIGVIVSLCLATSAQWHYRSRLKGAVPVTDRVGRWPVLLAETPDIGPALVGAWRARIVLPSDFAHRYEASEQLLILAHETEHARRGGGIWCLLSQAVAACFWFHPLAWWGIRALRHDQELACDAAVLRTHGDQRRVYANALLKTQSSALSLPVGCAWSPRHPITERIAMLKMRAPGRLRRIVGLLAVATILFGGSAMVYAAHQEQPRYATTPAAVEEAMALSQGVKEATTFYLAKHAGSLPKNNMAAQLPEQDLIHGKFVRSLSLRDGTIVALLRDKNDDAAGSVLFVPHLLANRSSVSWTCESPDIPDIATSTPQCVYRPISAGDGANEAMGNMTRVAQPAGSEYQLDLIVASFAKGTDTNHAERTTVGLCLKPAEPGSVNTGKGWQLQAKVTPKGTGRVRITLALSSDAGDSLASRELEGRLGRPLRAEFSGADGMHSYSIVVTPLAGCPARVAESGAAARLTMIRQSVKNQPVRAVVELMAQRAGLDVSNSQDLSARLVTLNFDQIPAERSLQLMANMDGKQALFQGMQVRFESK